LHKSGEYNILPIDVRQQTKSFQVNTAKAEDTKTILERFGKMKRKAGMRQGELEMKGFVPVWMSDAHLHERRD
jgi:hypothetical protein